MSICPFPGRSLDHALVNMRASPVCHVLTLPHAWWETSSCRLGARNGGSVSREARLALVGAAVVGALVFLVFLGFRAVGFGATSSEDVVEAFRDEGLEVGASFPVEQEPAFEKSPTPKTYEEGTRFEIPSLGRDSGGRVFVYESEEDLRVMKEYYEKLDDMPIFGSALHSHVYQEGLILLQINGELPKLQADRYGEVLREEVS